MPCDPPAMRSREESCPRGGKSVEGRGWGWGRGLLMGDPEPQFPETESSGELHTLRDGEGPKFMLCVFYFSAVRKDRKNLNGRTAKEA